MTSEVAAAGKPGDTVESWLAAALATEGRDGWLDSDGIRLRIREWGSAADPGVVLVHGGTAHAQWWDAIAPHLAVDRHVIAMDLSGHGDSDWRPEGYRLADWAREVVAVLATVASPGPPILVGHSMGASVALLAAQEPDNRLAGLVLLDSGLHPMRDAELAGRQRRADRDHTVFPTKRAAVESFHTRPPGGEHRHLPDLLRHVAETSVREVEDGWRWKVDRRIFLRDWIDLDAVESLDVPTLVVAAEHGMLTRERAKHVVEQLGPRARAVTLPLAGHHLMLDQPVALAVCLATAIAGW